MTKLVMTDISQEPVMHGVLRTGPQFPVNVRMGSGRGGSIWGTRRHFDSNVRPQDDFFRYVNGALDRADGDPAGSLGARTSFFALRDDERSKPAEDHRSRRGRQRCAARLGNPQDR